MGEQAGQTGQWAHYTHNGPCVLYSSYTHTQSQPQITQGPLRHPSYESCESHEQPSVTGHEGQNSVSGTELASERTKIMEITADQCGLCQAPSLLDSVIDLFNLRTLMPVRGHYWSGLRDAGTGQKLQDCEEKRVNNR